MAACESAAAHVVGARPVDGAWALRWSFEPWVLLLLAASALLYAVGLARLWSHAGRGRGIAPRQALAFAAGWLALAAALVSPLDPLGERLFSAHMLQHELMMVVAAPLLVIGRPLAAWAWSVPRGAARDIGAALHRPGWRRPWQWLSGAGVAWAVHALVLWGWHLPSWFDAALADPALHTLQHAAFLGSALLFWWGAFGATQRGAQGVALVYLFTTMVHTGALGALLTLSPTPWYPSYGPSAVALGIDPLEDQQLGGIVMWVPAGLAYVIAGLALAVRWMQLGSGHATPRGARDPLGVDR